MIATLIVILLITNLIFMIYSDIRFRKQQNKIWQKLIELENYSSPKI